MPIFGRAIGSQYSSNFTVWRPVVGYWIRRVLRLRFVLLLLRDLLCGLVGAFLAYGLLSGLSVLVRAAVAAARPGLPNRLIHSVHRVARAIASCASNRTGGVNDQVSLVTG